MIDLTFLSRTACAITLGLLVAAPAFAQPDGVGRGKSEKQAQNQGKSERGQPQGPGVRAPDRTDIRHDDRRDGGPRAERDDRRDGPRVSVYFTDYHRTHARNYYVEQIRSGNCPPGLAKKRNGCLPPGLAKKWHIGRPLPHDVVLYDPPAAIVSGLGAPPPMHRYVRVDTDLLLIELGTRLVIDAIEDLGGR